MKSLEKVTQEVLDVCVHALPRRAGDAHHALVLARLVVAETVDGIPLGFHAQAAEGRSAGKQADADDPKSLPERVMSTAQTVLQDTASKAKMVENSLGAHAYKIHAAGHGQEAADAARAVVAQLIEAYAVVQEIEALAIKAGDRQKIETCARAYRPAIREGLMAARAVVEWFAKNHPIPRGKTGRS
ncbi:MAG: hypothetical protein IT452_05745 [Planctomycetia bacterium]|nr:hypothetical protein [Planctomycetia bacterium]